MAKVSILKTGPKTVIKDYHRLLNLAEYKKYIKKTNDTILKLNLSWSLYYPACSTEPWQLHGLLNSMKKDGYDFKKIHPVENRTVVTDVWKGAEGNKWLPILKKYNLKYEPLTETKWIRYKPKAEMLALDDVFKPYGLKSKSGTVYSIPKMFIEKNIIHLPTIKTHGHTQMTGTMKNAFGGLITTRRHHCHKEIHKILVDLLQIQKEIHPGIFAVMDGSVAGDGAGPRTMIPKIKNTIIAGSDQVAIDAVSSHMMGYDPLKIPFIKISHDLGLGCGDVDQIDFTGITKNEFKKINYHFKTNKSIVIYWDQMLRRKIKVIEPLLFHTPLFNMCIFASAFYHDYVWYNLIGRKRINNFMKTEWGKLWRKY